MLLGGKQSEASSLERLERLSLGKPSEERSLGTRTGSCRKLQTETEWLLKKRNKVGWGNQNRKVESESPWYAADRNLLDK